jgi:hypothetical protein
MASDPLSPMAWLLAGLMPWWTGNVAEGLPKIVRSVEMDPGNLIAHWTLGYGQALVGNVAAASKEAEFMRERAPTMPYTTQLLALIQGMDGKREAARATLGDVVGLDTHHKFHLAESFAMAGDTDRAFTLLEEAVYGGFHPDEFLVQHCPFFESLRGSPRFDAVVATAIRLTKEFAA